MAASALQSAKRALVSVLVYLASAYGLDLQLTRDSSDDVVAVACKKVARKAHPDLSPIDRFWGWLRKKLRAMDLKDCVSGRPVLDKPAYVARVRRVLNSKAAQKCAANCAKSLRKVCKEAVLKKGAASSG